MKKIGLFNRKKILKKLMFTIDLFDTKNNNEETCLICHDKLSSEPCHTLECSHEYHIDCIISWFRSGNTNCPYCNSKPENSSNNDETEFYYSRSEIKKKFSILKRFSKKKDFPKSLKSKIDTILRNEEKLKELKEEIKEIKNEVGTYSEIKKKHNKISSSIWRKTTDIHRKKKDLLTLVNIVPLTIIKSVKKKSSNI